jgi:hypothetical protein
MKKLFIILVAAFSFSTINAQQPSVERSISGVQLGFMSAWAYHEMRLSNSIALRAEAGLGAGYSYHESFFSERYSNFAVFPVLAVEPRYYYNLNKRSQKRKYIGNNAGNFVAINTTVTPGWLIASNLEESSFTGNVSFVPTWGMRRNLGRNFDYELGAGLGYGFGFDGSRGTVFRPHLRIGYQF